MDPYWPEVFDEMVELIRPPDTPDDPVDDEAWHNPDIDWSERFAAIGR